MNVNRSISTEARLYIVVILWLVLDTPRNLSFRVWLKKINVFANVYGEIYYFEYICTVPNKFFQVEPCVSTDIEA